MSESTEHVAVDGAPEGMTFFMTWANSDNRLTQREWSEFCLGVNDFMHSWASEVHFFGFSLPSSPWQNASACFTTKTTLKLSALEMMRAALRQLAQEWRQDSIVFLVVNSSAVEFLGSGAASSAVKRLPR